MLLWEEKRGSQEAEIICVKLAKGRMMWLCLIKRFEEYVLDLKKDVKNESREVIYRI